MVSIRAPVRERIRARWKVLARCICFNPRSRAGANGTPRCWPGRSPRFQSALPCGSECGKAMLRPGHDRFNPRSRAGANPDARHTTPQARPVSIRAPVRERIECIALGLHDVEVSIRAPVRERIRAPRGTPPTAPRFNPRSRAGANLEGSWGRYRLV